MNEENTQQALTVHEPQDAVHQPPQNIVALTAGQARIEAVANTLAKAYEKASTLNLTPEEATALMADFPDEAVRSGARGDANLLYLEHAFVRQRMLEVFGPGQWSIINRRSWLDETGGWLYADVVLVCRGCFVGECIGAMRYSSRNARINYADAVKGAESDALGRICGTALGVGLQLWKKGFSEGWFVRQKAPKRSGPYQQPTQAVKAPLRANVEPNQATTATVLPAKEATEATRDWMIKQLLGQFGEETVRGYAIYKKWILPDVETIWDTPLHFVVTTKEALGEVVRDLEKWVKLEEGPNAETEEELPPDIANAVITLPRKGMKRVDYIKNPDTIGSLYEAAKNGDESARTRLFGVAENWTVNEWKDDKGQMRPPNKDDVESRHKLDLFMQWREINGKND